MPAALDRIYRINRIFPWADGHLNLDKSFVGHLTSRALPVRRSYFVNFVHAVQKILSLVALINHQVFAGYPGSCLADLVQCFFDMRIDLKIYGFAGNAQGILNGEG